jgi:hypothetical protein
MNECVQLLVAYKYMQLLFSDEKNEITGGRWRGGGVLHPSNPKAEALCARHVEGLLSRVVIPPATKGPVPCAPRGCHVVDLMSRVVSDPG